MARVYLSGGITGIADYKVHFDTAEKQLRDLGFAVINPSNNIYVLPESETTRDEYMTICLALLKMCDVICMLDGWEKSEGAKIERKYAKEHGYTVIHLEKEGNENDD